MDIEPALIEIIRTASRIIVRELGFMHTTLAATAYPPSAVHTLLEIDAQGTLNATQLVETLGLDKSSVSRILNKLIETGELKESTDKEDSRIKQLLLTAQGKRTVNKIHAYGQMQVTTALKQLNLTQQQSVAQGLTTYAQALHTCRTNKNVNTPCPTKISSGYMPGLVGRVAEMHAAFYSQHVGFGQFFESKVASGIAEFAGRLDQPCNGI